MCWKDAPRLIRLRWLPLYIPYIMCICESMRASSLLPFILLFLPSLPIPAAFVLTQTCSQTGLMCAVIPIHGFKKRHSFSMLLHIKTTHSMIPGAVEIKFREEKD